MTFVKVTVVTLVTKVKLIYFKHGLVGLAQAWCLLQAVMIKSNDFCKSDSSNSSDKSETDIFKNGLVGLAQAWCLLQAVMRIWNPAPLTPSGLNLLILHMLLLMLWQFVSTDLFLFVPSV